ncbi:MAG: rod shape-determining protein MreC [Bacilli bacterium]|nr:rod shape-determining protein MreC [Bacilli bacterium]
MKKKKRGKYKKIIVYIIIIVSVFSLLYYFINDNRSNNFLFSSIKDLSANISKVTSFSFNSKKKLDSNLSYEINKDYENEIKSLKETLSLNSLNSNKSFINATVVKRSTNYWYDIISIDKGKKDGIRNGLAVINNRGLVGKVIKTNNNTSDIKLLISSKEENYISAMFNYEDNNYYGLIDNYDLINNELTLKNVIGDFDKEKIKDINVTTSGLSDSFTSGLLIGKITNIKKDTFGISYNIIIKPSVDFNNINIVSVIVGDK